MIVQKFGGTSLATAEKLKSVAKIIVSNSNKHKTSVILSAMGKVTDSLIEIINTAINNGDWQIKLDTLESEHKTTIIELNSACRLESQKQLTKINYLFQEAHAKLTGVSLLQQCPDDIYAWLITLGEQLSVSIMYTQLISEGINVDIIDSRKCIITSEDAFAGEVNISKTKLNFQPFNAKANGVF